MRLCDKTKTNDVPYLRNLDIMEKKYIWICFKSPMTYLCLFFLVEKVTA